MTMIDCPRCGANRWEVGLSSDWRVCFYCGNKVSLAQMAAATAEQSNPTPEQGEST